MLNKGTQTRKTITTTTKSKPPVGGLFVLKQESSTHAEGGVFCWTPPCRISLGISSCPKTMLGAGQRTTASQPIISPEVEGGVAERSEKRRHPQLIRNLRPQRLQTLLIGGASNEGSPMAMTWSPQEQQNHVPCSLLRVGLPALPSGWRGARGITRESERGKGTPPSGWRGGRRAP